MNELTTVAFSLEFFMFDLCYCCYLLMAKFMSYVRWIVCLCSGGENGDGKVACISPGRVFVRFLRLGGRMGGWMAMSIV